jgi:hypothetical protein
MCWSVLGVIEASLTQLKFLLGLADRTETIEESMKGKNKNKSKLAGIVSKKIPSDNFEKILRFFQVQDGQEEFWAMVSIIAGQGTRPHPKRINHISDITFVYQTRARELQQVSGMKMLGTTLSKKEDRLNEAASLMLKSGNFQEYCEIQKELGQFEEAIAVAPKVSLQYW